MNPKGVFVFPAGFFTTSFILYRISYLGYAVFKMRVTQISCYVKSEKSHFMSLAETVLAYINVSL